MRVSITISKQQKQIALLYCTTALGVVIGILNSVTNTRWLEPELFGDVRYVQNLIAFVSSLLMVGFFTSGSRLLALSPSEEYSRRIRGVMCVILGITICVVVMFLLIMSCWSVLTDSHSSLTMLYFCAIPFCGSNLMLNYVNTTAQGDNHIIRISIARLLPSLLYLALAWLIYNRFGATPVRMLTLYNGTSFIILLLVIISTKPSFNNLKDSFTILNNENKHYGFNVYLGSLASVSTAYIAGITLGQFCENNANVGFFTLALNLASPLSMLPSIIGTAYFKRFASENQIGNKVLYGSISLTLISCVLFILLIKYVVAFLYPASYAVVATISSWLVLGTSMVGLGDMFNRFLGAHGLGKQIRNGAFACGAVVLVGNIVLVYFMQIEGAVITRIVSSFVYLFCMCFYYMRFVREQKCETHYD